MNTRNLLTGALTGLWIVVAAGCGGSSSSGDDAPTQVPTPPPPPPVTPPPPPPPPVAPVPVPPPPPGPVVHAVGGSVFGLHGTLVLQNNGGDGVTLTADGTFVFATTLATGAAYAVTVQTQPANQICTVDDGSGAIADADVTDVVVNCSVLTRIVGGTISGLDPSEWVLLLNNGADELSVNANGNFTFATPIAQSGAYNVTLFAQPLNKTCSVNHGSGTAGAADIEDVRVICSTNAHTVGGTLSGLSGTVQLQNNGANDITLNADGSFTFVAPVAQGATYNVTVSTQPATQTCVVTNGSGTMGGANIANINLSCTTNTTTLSASATELALSVTGLTEYGLSGVPASGVARKIAITNTGSYIATNLSVDLPTWPLGTTSSTTCGSTLAAGDDCAITITPGSVPSSDGTNPCSLLGTAPIPGAIQVSADNANTVTSNAVVLNYGCIYQGGYVYAFDDTVSTTQSVGGKVAATSDQIPASSGVIWSSNGSGGTMPAVANDVIYGTAESSTASTPNPGTGQTGAQIACDGANDGACNTNNIHDYYQNYAVGGPINTTYYAAGMCKQTIGSYSDWYLPAICELGYGGIACGNAVTPARQNMQSSLVDLHDVASLSNQHWSSTSLSFNPQIEAWYQLFSTSAPGQSNFQKAGQLGVRCSRAF